MIDLEERKRKEAFLNDLQRLSKQHGVYVEGCGCCGSPYLHIDDKPNIIKVNKELEHIQRINKEDFESVLKEEREFADILGESEDIYFGDFRDNKISETFEFLPKIPEGWKGVWRHKNGNWYEVLMLSNTNSVNKDYPPMVVYRGIKNGRIWSRSIDGWHLSMVKEGGVSTK